MTDQRLLQRAQDFDEQALGEIYDHWSPLLYRYAMRLLEDPTLAEDCVAETFGRFLVALRQGKGPTDFLQAYLFRVAHNWIVDHYRGCSDKILPLDVDFKADVEGEPPQVVDQNLERQRVREALALLTAEQQQVIILKFIEDWDNTEIARALGKPVGAVKALQHRALASLKKILIH